MPLAPHDLTVKLFLQLAVILAACRVCGWLGRRVGQTQVVSEMVAGVLLGPSLFGLIAPAAQAWLFPTTLAAGAGGMHPSMLILYALSQIGLVLYMFNIGLQRGVITPALFTIMVLMAVVTTLMASPLFELAYGRRAAVTGQGEQPA